MGEGYKLPCNPQQAVTIILALMSLSTRFLVFAFLCCCVEGHSFCCSPERTYNQERHVATVFSLPSSLQPRTQVVGRVGLQDSLYTAGRQTIKLFEQFIVEISHFVTVLIDPRVSSQCSCCSSTKGDDRSIPCTTSLRPPVHSVYVYSLYYLFQNPRFDVK